ncbi:hypothetical protein SPRG_02312 [Saprolegnia parasitica CBS 223.65]|uniref:Protein kinase domain-containing protein n=1 Tax=Saprolegnia parasitica (strain CBS 223.65) TaxID=695850 RepID=A0A067CS15_SAPPC|nr:hypothetical protein SPRG_02312 [Saprolegnia parasitica CBS 223.65]KDO33504.1 hypothetical protein SPRG_02312 [Saprolegnia parasitica CBS 223.65]|eukprot:XP_012196247.1 hypothetical protein SPRG_02312 [Saprolegnia parasitica CBS 223.65]
MVQTTRMLSRNFSMLTRAASLLPLSKRRVLHDVVAAMVCVHGQDLTDSGTSRKATEHATMTAEIGTVAWIAPKVLNGVQYSAKAEMYSLGSRRSTRSKYRTTPTCPGSYPALASALTLPRHTSLSPASFRPSSPSAARWQ